MDNELELYKEQNFEEIKHIDENGNEFWFARELMTTLEYSSWNKFIRVINKAMNSCKNSNNEINDHFVQVGKMVQLGSGAKRTIAD